MTTGLEPTNVPIPPPAGGPPGPLMAAESRRIGGSMRERRFG